MNLINLLYEPYVIIIFITLIITFITYIILINNKNKEEQSQTNIPKTLLYTFIISLVVLTIIKFGISYMNKNSFFQKGGVSDPIDRLTIIADDIDCDILEDA